MKARDIIITIWALSGKDWDKTFDYIKQRKPMSEELISKTFYEYEINDDLLVTIVDEDYPELLKKSKKPPFVIELA